MLTTALAGFSLGLSLILAIGAQNAFVLRQGLRRQHVFVVCLLCALSDALLIVAGVAGFGALVMHFPWIDPVFRLAGALFLLVYGARCFRSALDSAHDALDAASTPVQSLASVVTTTLALTWLNPHVYLDTLVLLGTVAATHDTQRWIFGLGAVLASFVFFFSLGYGARLLQPWLRTARAWRVLDALIGTLMWLIAWTLLRTLIP